MAAVMLDATGDLVLTGHDTFSTLTVDRSGSLGLEHQELRNIIERLAKAVNIQHEQVQALQTEMDHVHGELHAVRTRGESMDGRLGELEDSTREVRIKMDRVGEEIAELSGVHSQDEVPTKGDLQALHDRCDRMSRRLDEQEHNSGEDVDRLRGQLSTLEEQQAKQQNYLDEDLEARFNEGDDALMAQKMELEGLQSTVNEQNKRKANRSEIHDMQKVIEFVREEQKAESATLREAHQNLEKLDDCVSLAYENKTQTENLWRTFREETQEVRDWASRTLNDLKASLCTKMDEGSALEVFDELRREVRKDKMYFAQATSRVEDGIKSKAEVGDVLRLQDAVHEFRQQTKKPKQLLLGTKCLACNRAVTDDVTLEGMVDAAKERQRDELFHEVQRVLHKTPSGKDVLKFVAVHVGSPVRVYTAGGGTYDARDLDDYGPGSHHILPAATTPRPSGPGRPGVQTGVARAPPREVPPLVRVAPRRVEGPAPPRGPPSARRSPGYATARDALRPSLPPQRPLSPSDRSRNSGSCDDDVLGEEEMGMAQPSSA